jgi:hypothetical protein
MVIYLQHPLHGRKVATSDLEAKADYANGWEHYDPSGVNVAEEPSAPPASVNALEPKRRRKTID